MTTSLAASEQAQAAAEPSSDPLGPEVPEATRRRLAPLVGPDPWSWVVTAAVTLVAAIVRLVELGRPGHIIFDETYYAPNAWALGKYGVEWSVPEGGAAPVNGAPVLGDTAAYVVHPPLGKWMIWLGESIYGYNPFGWRIAAAIAGIASVLMITRIARRLFGSTVLGATAGLLVALDGMHVVMSRTALLDIFLLFFVVAAFGALVMDRDTRRERWLRAVEAGLDRPPPALPWWRFAMAGLLGCAVAVKWSGAFFIPVFLILLIWWEIGARRSAGVRRPWLDTLTGEWLSVLVTVVITPVVYLLSWTGWFVTDHGYHRLTPIDVRDSSPLGWLFGSLWNLFQYHRQVLDFHDDLVSDHPYASDAWQWLILAEPTAFHWSNEGSCGAPTCASAVLLLGTPLLWWSFLPALALLAWVGIARRDWRAAAIWFTAVIGIAPWLLIDRVMFYFYALPSEPFLVLAVVYLLGALITPGPSSKETLLGFDRRIAGIVLAGAYVMLVALNFAYFYPIYTGQLIPYEAWQARMWVSSWV
ncbi:MAG TPA: phospholipid carrier-dependent glycosyltransferase [Natronosporangium sp.]